MEDMRAVIQQHMLMPNRPQTIGWRLLLRHTEFCEGLAEVLMEKCQGNDETADAMLEEFYREFGKHDYELERWFDFGLCANSIKRLFEKKLNVIEF